MPNIKPKKLYSLSRVRPKRSEADEMDSVKAARKRGDRRAFDLLMQAQRYWARMDRFRKDRERNKRYCYGDQWSDIVEASPSRYVREDTYIAERGNVPLKNNLIRRLVRNVIGVYRGQDKEPTCKARDRSEQKSGEAVSTLLQCNMQVNEMSEVLARTMEEFLISAFVVHRKSYGWRDGKEDCWTDNVQPNNFFIDNRMRDFRGWDVTFLGEIHDVNFGQLCSQFAASPEEFRRLKDIYASASNPEALAQCAEDFGYSQLENFDFLLSSEPGLCRVIEVWRKEQRPRWRCHDWQTGDIFKCNTEDYDELVTQVNDERRLMGLQAGMAEDDIPLVEATWFMDDYWYYYYLTPFGHILKEGESPYKHESHPYVFKAYPFIDGEIHSFVGDIIDQQRYTNRLITLYDWVIRSTAKGVLLVPKDCLGDTTPEEFAESWSEVNGMIIYTPSKSGQMPTQVASNATNIGIGELLNMQLKLFEDISGVNGALQGKPGYSGTSGVLYRPRSNNAQLVNKR